MARVIANWHLDPKKVMRTLGIRCELGPFDFQPLRKYPFGTLGYDEEEGLKFETDTNKLDALITWVRNFHSKRQIPFLFDEGGAVFSCSLSPPTPGKAHPEDPKFEAAGLVRKKNFDFVWEIRTSS
jgi:hypothetical protein